MVELVTLEAVREMPKIDLHRHVDGAIDPALVWQLCSDWRIEVELKQETPQELSDFLTIRQGMPVQEVLARFALPISVMQTYNGIETVFQYQMMDLLRENIRYAELRFAPQYHTRKGLSLDEVIEAALSGINIGHMMTEREVVARLILCIPRECPPSEGEDLVRVALRFEGRGVVGIDLACNGAEYPAHLHRKAYQLTFDSILGRTVHAAGEFGERSQRWRNIKTAIFDLRADRIGHAIELAHSKYVLDPCIERGVSIESCPLSNVICGNAPDIAYLKLDELRRLGIPFCINSDDPALFHRSLSDNLYETARVYGWGMDYLRILMRTALGIAFISGDEKEQIWGGHFRDPPVEYQVVQSLKSKCCGAEVRLGGEPDFLGSTEVCTVHYVCLACGNPCDV